MAKNIRDIVNERNNNLNKLSVQVESFNISQEKVKIKGVEYRKGSGKAMPVGQYSRNGVKYREESVRNTFKTLEGAKMFFNHNTMEYPVGMVTNVEYREGEGLFYESIIDETEEKLISKLEKGLIDKVSIQCMVDNIQDTDEGIELDVTEFLELSYVTIPGFEDTSASLIESFRSQNNKEELDKNSDEDDEEEKMREIMTEVKNQVEELQTQIVNLQERMDILEKSDSEEQVEDEQKEGEEEGENSNTDESNEDDSKGESNENDESNEGETEDDQTDSVEKLNQLQIEEEKKNSEKINQETQENNDITDKLLNKRYY